MKFGRDGDGRSRHEAMRLTLCASLAALGLIVIAGWLFRVESLTAVVPGFSTMKFNTALGFVLVGTGLALAEHPSSISRSVSFGCGAVLLALGALTLGEYLFEVDIGIDQLVVRDRGTLSGSGHPGRMSLLTAVAWCVLGISIVLLRTNARRPLVIFAHSLAMIAGVVSILAAAGYAFGAEAFWGIGPYTYIAIHTALGLLVAAAAALMTRARDGWLEPYIQSPAALGLLAKILPLSIIIPVMIGLLVILGAGIGAYNAPYGLALSIPLTSVAMVLMALWAAARQRDADQARLQHERQLQLVVSELNHRVKNTLSVVQSFARQSFKNSASAAQGAAVFEKRLMALAVAHNLLTRENWDLIDLGKIIKESLSVHDDTGAQFSVSGPQILVTPKTAVTFAMTLHELATNASKYGALADPKGHVRIEWSLTPDRFHFFWKELDGPPCEPPTQRGFGSKLLKQALADELGGTANIQYDPDGLKYEVAAPARETL